MLDAEDIRHLARVGNGFPRRFVVDEHAGHAHDVETRIHEYAGRCGRIDAAAHAQSDAAAARIRNMSVERNHGAILKQASLL